ncbi:hypothetical protein C2E23DRAFT_716837 [Lenzites betulinus]|nr:hypothetical protein C2E23DRAFT_716837 [Lenzites betulinus]
MDGFMERLPEELVAYVFDCLHADRALSSAMLVNRQWYLHGARNLHARLVLNLGYDMYIDSDDIVLSFLQRLISPTLSTAHLVRHLGIFGMARMEVRDLILAILRHATGLRSLDLHSFRPMGYEDDSFFDDLRAGDFLPSLVALNIRSAPLPLLGSLTHTRRLHALRVHDPIDPAALRHITSSDSLLADGIQCLELAISAENPAAAVENVAYLASVLETSPLRALVLQFVLGSPKLMSWSGFEDAIGRMGPYLRALPDLNTLGLVIRPDPLMSVSGSIEHGSGEEQRELMTRRLAERLIADHGLSRLSRIDLRWHGWRVWNGQLIAVNPPEFLRTPQSWLYTQL